MITEVCRGGFMSDAVRRILCHNAMPNGRGGLGKCDCYREKLRRCEHCLQKSGTDGWLRRILREPQSETPRRFPRANNIHIQMSGHERGMRKCDEELDAIVRKWDVNDDDDQ